MDEKDPGTVLSPTTSDDDDEQDPAFIEEFSPISSKEQEQEEEDEFVATLLAREENSYHHHHHHHQFAGYDEASVQSARHLSIQWLIESRERLGLGYRTAYLSIMYFDRFLSLQSATLMGRDWMIRLLMVTCLSLAVKMEEVKVTDLSAYVGGGGRGGLTKFSFGIKWIKKMEFRVLNALQWEMRFISPFPFIHFFLRYLSFQPQLHTPSAVSRAAFIVFQSATVTSTTEYTPSVTAMAATLLVMDPSLSKAAMTAKITSSEVYSHGFAATPEQVHSCYEMIKNQLLLDDRSPLTPPRSSSSSE